MSQYTTGELAKRCGVTVRTVQYYDTRGILSPSALTEGGRRLYSEGDLGRLQIILFLRELGLSIDTIGKLLKEENPGSVIVLLLEQQERALREELHEKQEKLDLLLDLKKQIKGLDQFCVNPSGTLQETWKVREIAAVFIASYFPSGSSLACWRFWVWFCGSAMGPGGPLPFGQLWQFRLGSVCPKLIMTGWHISAPSATSGSSHASGRWFSQFTRRGPAA